MCILFRRVSLKDGYDPYHFVNDKKIDATLAVMIFVPLERTVNFWDFRIQWTSHDP